MSIPVIPTFTLGQKATAAAQQQQSDALTFLLALPHATYERAAAQTISTAGTGTAVQWDTNTRQNKIAHSTSTNPDRITPGEAGLYLIVAKISWVGDGTGTGYRRVWAERNGNASEVEGDVQDSIVGTGRHVTIFAGRMYFNGSSDYVRIMVQHTRGSNLDLGSGFNPRVDLMWTGGLF